MAGGQEAMPIYEYRCRKCEARSTFLAKSVNEPVSGTCSACGSADLERVISTFAYHRSIQSIHEDSGEPTMFPGPDYYKDPRNIGRWTEKRFKEMGMELPGEIKEDIQAAREGELPKSLKDKL